MPSIQEPIVTAANDVQTLSSPYTYGSYVRTGQNLQACRIVVSGFASWQQLGVRFTALAIPQGAIIASASIVVQNQTFSESGATADFKWYGDDVDDAPAWGADNYPRHITKTAAGEQANQIAADESAEHDVTTIVQEIVDRNGWDSGQDMRLVLTHGPLFTGPTVSVALEFDAYEANPAGTLQPVLDVIYTEGGGEEAEAGARGGMSLQLGVGL